jgi:hypothetical protein
LGGANCCPTDRPVHCPNHPNAPCCPAGHSCGGSCGQDCCRS